MSMKQINSKKLNVPLTKKQNDIFLFIVEYHTENNRPPTYRKIAEYFGFQIKCAYDHVKAIEKKGYIVKFSYINLLLYV